MPLVPEFRRERKEDLCEFSVSIVYIANSRTLLRDHILKKKSKQNRK